MKSVQNINNNKNNNEYIENLKKEINEKDKKIFGLEKRLKEEEEKNRNYEAKIIKLEKDIETLKKNEKILKIENNVKIDSKDKISAINALINKDNEIEDLRKKLARFPFILEEGEKLMHINITNTDYNIQNYSIICKSSDVFNQIENKLYEEYPILKTIQTYFIFNGKIIEKYKTLEENKINDNAVIILFKADLDN